jgi:hypothetical protein
MIGKHICDLAPSQTNNRNSEGAFITLKNGDILFVYTRYRGDGHDDECTADLYGMISTDDGESFGDPFPVFSCEDVGADNIMSVSLMRMYNGDIGLFYLQKHNTEIYCLPYLVRSSDEGKTWYGHTKCVNNDGYYVLNNDRVLRLESGRLLMALARHSTAKRPDGKTTFGSGKIYILSSDDDGYTWDTFAEDIVLPVSVWNDHGQGKLWSLSSAMEPGLVQLKNGLIWCYIRTMLGRQYEMFSTDEGKTWTVPAPSRFTSPSSPLCTKRMTDDRLFVVWNPIPKYNGSPAVVDGVWTDGRKQLNFAVLDEEGKQFLVSEVLEYDEGSGYCYTAIHETESGNILLAYCAGGKGDKNCLNRLRIRKLYKESFVPVED